MANTTSVASIAETVGQLRQVQRPQSSVVSHAALMEPQRSGSSVKPPMSFLAYLIAMLSGAANPIQSGANAELNKQLASPLWAGLIVYASGLLGLLIAQAVLREAFPAHDRLLSVRPWAWFGGFISIGSTMAGLILAQRLGAGVFTGLTLTASLTTSILLDHFGWIGFRHHAASPSRLAGCALMIIGLWIVARF